MEDRDHVVSVGMLIVLCVKADSVLPKQLHDMDYTRWFVIAFAVVVRPGIWSLF